ncbi:polysaccharide deacetylase family protein [Maricaulis sp.]|uniref:polysaccharide deacetylase family protein n=1 Tax=Maricaulis sp. TaxID=1486257 RepID=UPI00263927C5|nr:polysaccharide deacetylase family protein [Maricaulis sp.]
MRTILFFLVILSLLVMPSVASGQTGPSPADRRIALSFDDAPRGDGPIFTGEERTAALLDSLQTAGVGTAVFFVTTRGLDTPAGRERIARYAEAGHLIANHSHSHTWLSGTDPDAYIADIDRAEGLLPPHVQRRPWFRFPFLDEGNERELRDRLRDALDARGLMNGYVTVDNYDWYIDQRWQQAVRDGRPVDRDALRRAYVDLILGAVEFYDSLAVSTLGRSPAHVLLLHENDLAAAFVDDLVIALRVAGWTIVSPDEAYADPIASIVPQTLMTRQGHVGALAVDAGADPRTFSHRAIEEEQIDAMLEERGVFGEPLASDGGQREKSG